jgi:SAM-dependent methyltransferase
MLEQARKLQATTGVTNVTWRSCDVYNMPFLDGSFSLLITRYAFHHLEYPHTVMREMTRVCQPGGRVVVIDSAPPAEKAQAFNTIEKRRDPSHTKALTQEELTELMCAEGLVVEKRHLYAWQVSAESLLARSFPADDSRDSIYRSYEADVGVDATSMNARFIEGVLHVTFPTLITVARKSTSNSPV